MNSPLAARKAAVAAYWEDEPCGIRGVAQPDRRQFFHAVEDERYSFEPHIESFAGFRNAQGKRILEIGVGAGSDYVKWLRAGARAVGIDITEAAVRLTREHADSDGLRAILTRSDCEQLP